MATTLTQQRALALIPKASAALSLVGSLFIITDVLSSREKIRRPYSRILLMMSLFDFTTSIAQGLSTWPIPSDSGVLYASGSEMTCNAQGFFTQLGVGAPIYNCSLSFYYLIVIAFPLLKEAQLRQAEWVLHGVPLVFAYATAIMGIPLTLYNSSGLWCWISALPGSCGNDPSGSGDCIRGDNAWIYRWAIYYAPVWASVLTITVNMAVVTYFVWSSERKIDSENASTGADTATAEEAEEQQDQGLPKKPAEAQTKKSALASQVFWQAFYYVLAFYVTWIFPTILRLLQTLDKAVPYYVILLMAILLPLQGFFNFLVYVRPRVVRYRLSSPGSGLWFAIGQAIRKTVSFVPHRAGSGRDSGGEMEDMATLDPCYAMQVQREKKAASSTPVNSKGELQEFLLVESPHSQQVAA